MFIKLKLLLMALWLSQAVSQTVVINEFLASNVTSNPEMVDFDDYSDWIELYNINNDPIVLDGYFITDDFADPLNEMGFFGCCCSLAVCCFMACFCK